MWSIGPFHVPDAVMPLRARADLCRVPSPNGNIIRANFRFSQQVSQQLMGGGRTLGQGRMRLAPERGGAPRTTSSLQTDIRKMRERHPAIFLWRLLSVSNTFAGARSGPKLGENVPCMPVSVAHEYHGRALLLGVSELEGGGGLGLGAARKWGG